MRKGFTLVELLVVLVIIGVIVGLILPNTLRAIEEANERECAANLRAIDTAMQLCYTETRDWAQCNTIAAMVPQYLDVQPTCPFNIAYGVQADPNSTSSQPGWESVKTTHFAVWPPRNGSHL